MLPGNDGTRRLPWTGRCPPPFAVVSQRLSGEAWPAIAPTPSDRLSGSDVAASKLQEPIHHHVVQIVDLNILLLEPSAEIGDYGNLLFDRVVSIALLGHTGGMSVENSFKGPWRSRSIVVEKVKSWFITFPECQAGMQNMPRNHRWEAHKQPSRRQLAA
jgi:hypothetical protein